MYLWPALCFLATWPQKGWAFVALFYSADIHCALERLYICIILSIFVGNELKQIYYETDFNDVGHGGSSSGCL